MKRMTDERMAEIERAVFDVEGWPVNCSEELLQALKAERAKLRAVEESGLALCMAIGKEAPAAEDRIRELEAEVARLRKTEGHYIGCPLRVKLAAGIAPMCTPCTCNEIANKNAEAELERVRWVLDEIVSAYRAYRACGVIPAPDPYQRLVEAIKCADELAAALKEGE